jgi:hypothetical protein
MIKKQITYIFILTTFICITLFGCDSVATLFHGDKPETVATPTATPIAGTYTEAKIVTLSCITQGAEIYYTLNGINPTTASLSYSSPIIIDSTTTLKAMAIKEGMINSQIFTAVYIINIPPPSPPNTPTNLEWSPYGRERPPSVYLEWSPVPNTTGYYVYRSLSIYSSYIRVGSSDTNSYKDTGVATETTYYYKVSAYNDNGESSLSSYVMVSVRGDGPQPFNP